MKVLFEHPVITVWFHAERRVVHHRIARPVMNGDIEVIQAAFNSGTEAMRQHRASKWLSDDRLQLVMPADIEKWCRTQWYPATRAAGWQYWAIIQPESAVAKLFVSRLTVGVKAEGLNVHLSEDVSEALAWLDRCDLPG